MPTTIRCDVAILGGGLAGGLIALALRARRPDCDIRLIEASDHFGGNHLWSFFASDVSAGDRGLVAPLISQGWPRYDVRFPGHCRTLATPYYAIDSHRFDRVIRSDLPERALMPGRRVASTGATHVVLDDGTRVETGGVIDCRGPGDLGLLACGWQKFLGRELALSVPHPVEQPIVMDATVEQIDGYRFLYTLPFNPTTLFVEDTYYSDTPALDRAALGARIDAHAGAQGWQVERVMREETGVLPVVIDGDFDAYWHSGGAGVAKAGLRGGLFHPLTSYSLPDAVRTAQMIASATDLSGAALHELLYRHARRTWQARGFYRMLAAMLFRAAEPEARYRVLERFYRLNPRLIGHFYAGRSTLLDKARILSGKPPVPIGRALRAIGGRG